MAEKIVIKPILPANPNLFADAEKIIIGELSSAMLGPVARTLVQAEENYINNWEHKPKIVSKFVHQKTQLKLTVTPFGTNKRYWAFVSLGTREHTIIAKSGENLYVPYSYIPKTTPSGVYGGPGTYTGGVVYLPQVRQKIKPRNFEKHIVDKYENNIRLIMEIAFKKALRSIT